MEDRTFNLIQNILVSLIFLLGLFVAYQVLKKIFGGSWETEGIFVTLLIIIITSIFTIIVNLAQLKSDHSHLAKQFSSLAKDFKEVRDIVKKKL